MAEFVSTQNGNWNDGATWGNTSPGTEGVDWPSTAGGDTATIAGQHTVTIPAGHAALCTLAMNAGAAGIYTHLVINGSLKLEAAITPGSYSKVTVGAGATLDLGSHNITYGNGSNLWYFGLYLSGSVGNYATLTSTPSGGCILALDNSCLDTDCSYFTVTDLGDSRFCYYTAAGQSFLWSDGVFSGNGEIRTAGVNPAADMILQRVDFRSSAAAGTYLFRTEHGGAAPNDGYERTVSACTFSSTNRTGIRTIGNAVTLDGIIGDNVFWEHAAYPPNTIQNSVMGGGSGWGSGANLITNPLGGDVVDGNYFVIEWANAHPIAVGAGSPITVTDNVWEVRSKAGAADHGEIVAITGDRGFTITGNLLIDNWASASDWSGVLYNSLTTGVSTTLIERNTVVTGVDDNYGLLARSETSDNRLINTTVRNNCVVKKVNSTNSRGVNLENAEADQVVYTDYNNWYGLADVYYQVAITGKTEGEDEGFAANDLAVDPQFVDPTRNISTWDASLGGAGTAANAISQLLLINGYDSTDKDQKAANIPAGYTPAALHAYVRNGFAPTNPALKGAGSDGGDIGAMEVLVEKAGSDTAAVAEAASLTRGRPGQQEAYLGAFGSLGASRPGYLCGYLLSLAQQGQAFLKGSQPAAASQASYAEGQAGSLRVEQPALAVAMAAFLGSLPAHAHGVGGAAGEQVVFINAERLYLEVAQPAHVAALSAFEGSQRAQAAGMQQLLASKAAWLRAVWSAAGQQPAFLEGVSSLLVASQPAAACAWESAAHHLPAYAVAALPAGRIAFQLGSQQLLLSAGRTYPLREPRERLQVIARSAGGTVRVMDKGVGVRLIRLALAGLGEADHSALTVWFETVAAGALNAFTFVDEAGASHQVRWMGGLDLAQTAPGRWAGEIVLEKVA